MTDSCELEAILKKYRVEGTSLFAVGTFDTGVTVLSQQIRALNFIWAAIESSLIGWRSLGESISKSTQKIAVVGGGFAGLSIVAGLLAKNADVDITIFEQRDTLLPLQQGSDSRWLHPHIYDWPGGGSESSVAMLPVLNWTAARASDVVVQILADWKNVLEEHGEPKPKLYCNARHLQIHESELGSKKLQIEWVGELRDASDGRPKAPDTTSAQGRSEEFDLVILAVGFGLERDGALSYWRNETIGQPSLDQPRKTYLVSGQGDGAMIDLLRLRIAQFRQDRILPELFRGRNRLVEAIKRIHANYGLGLRKKGLFLALEGLEKAQDTAAEFEAVKQNLVSRLRRDTEVILHLKVKKLAELFDLDTARISFQNRLLVYLLYKCGGFIPSSLEESQLISQHAISSKNVIRRHGTLREEQLREALSIDLYKSISDQRARDGIDSFSQMDGEQWPGGYFGFPGPTRHAEDIDDTFKGRWRKEYLPGPTELLATSFCAALSGELLARHASADRLRVTLHRAVTFGKDELLQQCCEYAGSVSAKGAISTAARTFAPRIGTIGVAYETRRIVRTHKGVTPGQLRTAMSHLGLKSASRSMSEGVGFVLAIPLLEPEGASRFYLPTPVAGVIYVDSSKPDFFIEDEELRVLVRMTQSFLDGLVNIGERIDRIRNVPLTPRGDPARIAMPLPDSVRDVLELVGPVDPPATLDAFQLNYDYSDFVPVEGATV